MEPEPNRCKSFTAWKPRTAAFGLGFTSKPGLWKPRFCPPIKYLSSGRIVTWSIRRLCSFSRSFTSGFQICDTTKTLWVAIENPWILRNISGFSTAIQRRLVRLQIWKPEVKPGLKLHNLRSHHVTIRSELKYLFGAKVEPKLYKP
jgi:hypothetical protein